MTKEEKYTIELTKEQMLLIANCVEDCHRFACGETELNNLVSMLDNSSVLCRKLKELKTLVVPELGYNEYYKWSGFNCPNKHQKKFIAQSYQIYREIYHQIAIENGKDNVYTSDTLTCDEGGQLIKIKKI